MNDVDYLFIRIVTVSLLSLLGAVVLLFFGLKVVNKDKTKVNIYFSFNYFAFGAGFVVNIIIVLVRIGQNIYFVHAFAILCIALWGPLFNFLFLLNYYYKIEGKTISFKIDAILFVTFTIAFTTAVFYPGAIYIDVERANLPIWSFWFFLFSMIITGFITLTCFILGIKISSKIEDDLKKKWKYYISGVVLGNLLVIGAELINWLNDSTIRVVWIFITLPLTILMAGLLYYGAFKYL